MALGLNSYGDTAEVASYVLKHANQAGKFDATTRPTLLRLESDMDQLSALINVMLENMGFATPITQASVKLVLDLFVNRAAAEMVEGINGYGRFGPTPGKGVRGSKWAIIMEDARAFIKEFAAGMERMGAAREFSETAGLGFRDTDESGDEVHPLFQRDAHGGHWTNWDTD